jgi:ATP-dependent Clp protease ATP-binding subunit ClpC
MPESLSQAEDFADESEENGTILPEQEVSAAAPVELFSQSALNVLERSEHLARERAHQFVTSDDLFAALVTEPECAVSHILDSLAFSGPALVQHLAFILGRNSSHTPSLDVSYSPRMEEILAFAKAEAGRRSARQVETSHFLIALLRDRRGVPALLLETPGLGLEPIGAALNRAMREDISDRS